MTSRYQHAKRLAFWKGFAIALLVFSAWCGLLSWAGWITSYTGASESHNFKLYSVRT